MKTRNKKTKNQEPNSKNHVAARELGMALGIWFLGIWFLGFPFGGLLPDDLP
jgi:hypothetical protein